MQAYLILANGRILKGKSLGCQGTTVGEVVFATGMVGFEETLTDPSYYGQIITQTYPLIGNYGMTDEDYETKIPTMGGLIVRESTAYEMHEMDTENATLLDAAHQGAPFYSEPVIANVMHVENCLTQCDALNLKIIQGILNGESYDSIEDRLFLSRSALNYRLKKIFTYAQTQNRKEFESLFRHYFTKENNL